MSDRGSPREGACRCGRVRVRIDAPPLLTGACHCTGCQRMSSSAFSLTANMRAETFAVTAGEPVIGGLHGPARHYFCGYCMTWMFTRPEQLDWIVNLRPTMLEDPSWFSPFMEVMTSEKLPWARTPAQHSFDKFPPMERYQSLVDEYAPRARDLAAAWGL